MENSKDKIFCYSGTGNSFAAAKQLSQELDMELVHLIDEMTSSDIKGKRCIIIYPTYAYGMPKTVKKFILNSTFNIEYFAVLTTIGSTHGGALAEAIKLLKKRGQKVHYSYGIKAVENFVHMFGFPNKEEIESEVKKQYEITNKITNDIKEQKQNNRILFRPESSFVSKIFRSVTPIFAKRYKFLDNCNKCGICTKVCPAHAILQNENEKPIIQRKKCDFCQACMQLCPQKAIKFGKVKPNGKRYCHPDIRLSELIKR